MIYFFLTIVVYGLIRAGIEYPPVFIFLLPIVLWLIGKVREWYESIKKRKEFMKEVKQKRRYIALLMVSNEGVTSASLAKGIHFKFCLSPSAAKDGIKYWRLDSIILNGKSISSYDFYGYNLKDLKEEDACQICRELSKMIGGVIYDDMEYSGSISLLSLESHEMLINQRRDIRYLHK